MSLRCTLVRLVERVGLGSTVVKRLTRSITGRNHTVYCDNFFTSVPLFIDLKDKVYACGTYNHARKCYPKCLKPQAKAGLKNRGDYKYAQSGNLASLWQDTIKDSLSSSTNQSPQEVSVRHRQKDGRHVEVPFPLSLSKSIIDSWEKWIKMNNFVGIILYVKKL